MKNCTRFFTQELIDEIRMRLAAIQGAKDSQFEKATHFNKEDQVAIVQQGKNKRIEIGEFKNWLYAMDNTPTLGSENAVTSDGIYRYILNIIDSIVSEGKYLYIKGDSNMFDYLIHGPGDIYTQEQYDIYCNEVYNAIANGYFVIVDDAICITGYTDDPQFFSLSYISPAENVVISALMENQHWVKRSGKVDINRFLIDNTYLKDNQYITANNITALLTNYITNEDLARLIENYPQQGSSKLVTSDGIWQAIQNALTTIILLDEVLIISSTMMETMINGSPGSPAFNLCCETIFPACQNGSLIIFNNGICSYTSSETEEIKTFDLSVITTSHTYQICGVNQKGGQLDVWNVYRQNTVNDNHLIVSNQLNLTLQSYYTKSLIDALIATLLNYINNNTISINRLRSEYEERMESTPKYHKANWLVEDVDAKGRVTNETTLSSPANRFASLWWAVKEDKLITLYGIPDIYRESLIGGSTPDTATSVVVKFFINGVISTYEIEKEYNGGILSEENLYLQVTRTDDPIDRVNSIMTKGIDIIDNPTMVGSNVSKYTVDLSDNLDQFSSFSAIGDISNVPLIIDPNLNIASLMGDLKVIQCGGLLTDKTDYINLPDILGYPSLTLYGSLVDDNMYISGSINLSMNEDDNLVINYVEVNGSTHSLVIDNNISNDQIAAFLNSIIKNFSVIKDTKALSLLLSIFQCTVQFGGVVQGANFFIRTNNTYQLHTNNNVPLLEIAEV